MPLIMLLFVLTAGAMLPLQAGLNSTLGRRLDSPLWASVVSFSVGLGALLVLAALTRASPSLLGKAAGAPWWLFLGGVCGAIIVLVISVGAGTLGFTTLAAGLLVGQLVASTLMDQWGLLRPEPRPVDLPRLAGLTLLIAGFVLLQMSPVGPRPDASASAENAEHP